MSNITYHHHVDGITAHQLRRLHVGWPNPPSPETFLKSLFNMNAIVLALDQESDEVIGFVCGMTDQVMILYIWDLEVLSDYQDQGVEDALLSHLLDRYAALYQINANPHPGIQTFFASAGFVALGEEQCQHMTRMDIARQHGL